MLICQNFMELQALDGAPHRFSKVYTCTATNFNLAKLGFPDRRAIHPHGRMRPFADENAIKPRAPSTGSPIKRKFNSYFRHKTNSTKTGRRSSKLDSQERARAVAYVAIDDHFKKRDPDRIDANRLFAG